MRPNILFITVDQWRGDCLGLFGHAVVHTPNLNALAQSGVAFKNHFSQCSPCGPSRASIHTGLYMHAHRSVDNGTPLDARFTNMAIEARSHGYDPMLFGYTDTTLDPRTLRPGDPGLSTYESMLPGYGDDSFVMPFEEPQWIEWLAELGYDTSVGRESLHHPDGATYGPPIYAAEHTDTAFLTEKIVDAITVAPDGWFIHASYLRPHPPFVVPEPYNSMFDPRSMPPPNRAETLDEEVSISGLVRSLTTHGQRAPEDPATLARWRAVYYAMIAEIDNQLGRLIDEIDLDTTTVIITSDHGEMLGDHWLAGKSGFYPESFHVPLIIAGHGIAPSTHPVEHFTENIDIFPTVMNLIDAPVPAQCQGASLLPFLTGGTPSTWRDAAHWEWDWRTTGLQAIPTADPESFNLAVLHDRNGTYVHFANGKSLFFDLDTDAGHTTNASTSSQAGTYAQRLLTWRLKSDFGELVNVNQISAARR